MLYEQSCELITAKSIFWNTGLNITSFGAEVILENRLHQFLEQEEPKCNHAVLNISILEITVLNHHTGANEEEPDIIR